MPSSAKKGVVEELPSLPLAIITDRIAPFIANCRTTLNNLALTNKELRQHVTTKLPLPWPSNQTLLTLKDVEGAYDMYPTMPTTATNSGTSYAAVGYNICHKDGNRDGCVDVWNSQKGHHATIQIKGNQVFQLKLNPRFPPVMVANVGRPMQNSLVLWDVSLITPPVQKQVLLHDEESICYAFAPNGMLVTCTSHWEVFRNAISDGTFSIWSTNNLQDIDNGKVVCFYRWTSPQLDPQRSFQQIAFMSNVGAGRSYVASRHYQSTTMGVYLWDVGSLAYNASEASVATTSGTANGVSLPPQRTQIMLSSDGRPHEVRCMQFSLPPQRKNTSTCAVEQRPTSLSPGLYLIILLDRRIIQLYNVPDGSPFRRIELPHSFWNFTLNNTHTITCFSESLCNFYEVAIPDEEEKNSMIGMNRQTLYHPEQGEFDCERVLFDSIDTGFPNHRTLLVAHKDGDAPSETKIRLWTHTVEADTGGGSGGGGAAATVPEEEEEDPYNTRLCASCQKEKPTHCFSKNQRRKGPKRRCQECTAGDLPWRRTRGRRSSRGRRNVRGR